MKKIDISFIGIFFTSFYLEVFFKMLLNIAFSIESIVIVFFNSLAIALLFYLVFSLFNDKVIKILHTILVFILCVYFCSQLCIYKMFGFYYDLGILDQAKQVTAFLYDALVLIKNNILNILILLVPFILNIIINNFIKFRKLKLKSYILLFCSLILCLICEFSYVYLNKEQINSSYYLAFKTKNTDLSIPRLGVIPSLETDIYKRVIGLEEIPEIIIDDDIVPEIKELGMNTIDIGFDELVKNEDNETLLKMHQYFNSLTGTKENEYTGLFKDKNLIVIVGESFSKIGVRKDLTPTLYRLINSSFVFNKFYSTSMYSTVGGELQFNTSLYPLSGLTDIWKQGTNYWPMGLGNMFKNIGYSTHAYHDNTYNYLDRDKYLNSIGFTNYIGCNNGMEDKMNCRPWTESDIEMIDGTINDYISEEHFMTYYMSVSGHGLYSYDPSVNVMGSKYLDFIKSCGYDYCEESMAYLSSMIEFDKAVEHLIKGLDAANRLDDTVIVILGDHYPYYLEPESINELAGKNLEQYIEVCENNLIIYNSEVEKTIIDKVGSTIDVLPTIYNLFDMDYDSRLLMGSDILSETETYAIFGNNSWVSDKGIYYASTNEFVNNQSVDENYFEKTNRIVNNKITMSLLLAKNDYFRLIWPK